MPSEAATSRARAVPVSLAAVAVAAGAEAVLVVGAVADQAVDSAADAGSKLIVVNDK